MSDEEYGVPKESSGPSESESSYESSSESEVYSSEESSESSDSSSLSSAGGLYYYISSGREIVGDFNVVAFPDSIIAGRRVGFALVENNGDSSGGLTLSQDSNLENGTAFIEGYYSSAENFGFFFEDFTANRDGLAEPPMNVSEWFINIINLGETDINVIFFTDPPILLPAGGTLTKNNSDFSDPDGFEGADIDTRIEPA